MRNNGSTIPAIIQPVTDKPIQTIHNIMQILRNTILIFLFIPPLAALAQDPDLAKLFMERDANGTIVISSLDSNTQFLNNKARAEKRLLPASTFKIPNTLIALDTGAVADEKEIIKWDGQDKGWYRWNKDQSLETAFPFSCVWFYQELAGRVGNASYLKYLDGIDYGNEQTGKNLDTFWLVCGIC